MIRFFIRLYYSYFRSYRFITRGMTKMVKRLDGLQDRMNRDLVALEMQKKFCEVELANATITSAKFKELFGIQ